MYYIMNPVYFYILFFISQVFSINYFDSNAKYFPYDHNKQNDLPLYVSEHFYTSDYANSVYLRKLEKNKLKKFSEDFDNRFNFTNNSISDNRIKIRYSTDKNL